MDLQLVFGIIGNILSLYFGIKIIETYIKNRNELIVPFNDYLFFIMFFNTFNWMYYGIILQDMYIFINNIIGLFGNFFMILIIWKKIEESRKIYIEIMCSLFISYFIIMTFLFNFTSISHYSLVFACGVSAVFTSILSYLAPILIIRDVIETKNHKLIYIPQVIIGFITMIIFTVYGFVVNNPFIIVVDVVIVFLCIIQLMIYIYYKYLYKTKEKIKTTDNIANKDNVNLELVELDNKQIVLLDSKSDDKELTV